MCDKFICSYGCYEFYSYDGTCNSSCNECKYYLKCSSCIFAYYGYTCKDKFISYETDETEKAGD